MDQCTYRTFFAARQTRRCSRNCALITTTGALLRCVSIPPTPAFLRATLAQDRPLCVSHPQGWGGEGGRRGETNTIRSSRNRVGIRGRRRSRSRRHASQLRLYGYLRYYDITFRLRHRVYLSIYVFIFRQRRKNPVLVKKFMFISFSYIIMYDTMITH